MSSTTSRRYSKEEFARRGDALYEQVVRPQLAPESAGQFVAIDIETGEYEIGPDELTACDNLQSRIPKAQPWLVRIGSRYAHRLRTVSGQP